jgi:hypothetical protein
LSTSTQERDLASGAAASYGRVMLESDNPLREQLGEAIGAVERNLENPAIALKHRRWRRYS